MQHNGNAAQMHCMVLLDSISEHLELEEVTLAYLSHLRDLSPSAGSYLFPESLFSSCLMMIVIAMVQQKWSKNE